MMFNKEINAADYNNLCPNNINIDIASKKTLATDNSINTLYCIIENMYRFFLERYLCQKSSLKIYDEDPNFLDLKFSIVTDLNKDFYQYYSNLKYFYIRNTLYVENLEIRDLNLLIKKFNSKTFDMDSDIIDLIERTYKKVIMPYQIEEKKMDTNYGPLTSKYFAPINCLVIGFRYNEFYDEGMTDDEWFKRYSIQKNYLIDLIPKMEKKLNDELDIECKIIQYHDDSVKKKEQTKLTDKKM